jgi:hypothetical protein
MPLQATSGAASYDAFGGGVPVVPAYIEEVFSTFVFTGTGSNLTIQNEIDLSTKGGLAWMKGRVSPNAPDHHLFDTARGFTKNITTNSTAAQNDYTTNGPTALTNGFSIPNSGGGELNRVGDTYVSWTFRKQPKFFDVLTYTGTGTGTRTLNHDLGSAPAFFVIKRTDSTGTWFCYHTSLGVSQYLALESDNAAATFTNVWQTPTSTTFGFNTSSFNVNGATYVAYLFAHNAGGFGLTGTDNVISCGSFSTNASGVYSVNLGYEPQWVMIKVAGAVGNWHIQDNMRGMTTTTGPALQPNLSNAEGTAFDRISINSTGFFSNNTGGVIDGSATYIYIAIRRGPMKVPTVGTSVFSPSYGLSASNSEFVNAGFPIDLNWRGRTTGDNNILQDRLRGASQLSFGNLTSAESTSSVYTFTTQNGCTFTSTANFSSWINWSFRRAPSFFDVVCYTGTGASSQVLTHNLTVIPTLTIFKKRSASNPWDVVSGNTSYLQLNDTLQAFPDTSIAATSTTITAPLGAGNGLNASGATYVAYLFATCAGVSKVFSYTGNGSSQTINCGFTGGARFVLIKRTDSTGDWYVWDSARGIVSGNDPHLSLNSTAAEVTTDDTIDTDSTGFVVNQVSATNVNVSSATYIGLAIA